MQKKHPRMVLSETILRTKLTQPSFDFETILLPINFGDLSSDILISAAEAVWKFTPVEVRLVLPVVLECLQTKRSELLQSGYVDSYFIFVNSDFLLDSDPFKSPTEYGLKFSPHFKKNWVADTISALNRDEHLLALEWTTEFLSNGDADVLQIYSQHLIMFGRILAMALDMPEEQAPSLED